MHKGPELNEIEVRLRIGAGNSMRPQRSRTTTNISMMPQCSSVGAKTSMRPQCTHVWGMRTPLGPNVLMRRGEDFTDAPPRSRRGAKSSMRP